jgi:hypothetical protein
MKKLGSLTLILVVALGVAFVRGSVTTAKRARQVTAEPGTLDWYAQQAQADGVTAYQFNAGEVEYNQPGLWDDVLANYSIVRGQVVDARSYPALLNRSIETWYKFRVDETLSQKPTLTCAGCGSMPTPPSDMLPLQANEILFSKLGGTLDYNGVTLIGKEHIFPDLLLSQNYMLILQVDTSAKVGKLDLGPWGAYTVNSSGGFQAINPEWNVYQTDLTNRYGNSISQLRTALNPPQPSSCDPVQASNCEDAGGTWNNTACTCKPAFDPCTRKPWLCE